MPPSEILPEVAKYIFTGELLFIFLVVVFLFNRPEPK